MLMIDKKYMEYINKAVDKTISQKEQSELTEYLSSNEEAEKYYSELSKLSELMTQVKDVEPPDDLKQTIISAIPKNRYAVSRKTNPLRNIMEILKGREKPRFAYSFSAGLAVGAAVVVLCFYSFYNGTDLNRSHLTGTLVFPENMRNLTTVAIKDFVLGNTGVAVKIESSNEFILVDMSLSSPAPVDFTIEYKTKEMSFHGFQPQDRLAGGDCIEFTHDGENRYLLLFRKDAKTISSLKITITSDDTVFERIINISAAEN